MMTSVGEHGGLLGGMEDYWRRLSIVFSFETFLLYFVIPYHSSMYSFNENEAKERAAYKGAEFAMSALSVLDTLNKIK